MYKILIQKLLRLCLKSKASQNDHFHQTLNHNSVKSKIQNLTLQIDKIIIMNKTVSIAIFIVIMYILGILICKEYAIYKQP